MPMVDRVLVQRAAAETKSKGGVLIPEQSRSKVQMADVMAVGPGMRTEVRVFLHCSYLEKVLICFLMLFGDIKCALKLVCVSGVIETIDLLCCVAYPTVRIGLIVSSRTFKTRATPNLTLT